MSNERLDVLRAIDGYDRLGDEGVFDRLTSGRTDASGAVTPGCGLSAPQAAALVGFLNVGSGSLIEKRFWLMCKLEETVVNEKTQKTAWDVFIDMYAELPKPKNVAWVLDDLCELLGAPTKAIDNNEIIDRLRDYMRSAPQSSINQTV